MQKEFEIEPGIIMSKLDLKDGDTIVITVDPDIWNINTVYEEMSKIMKKHFPNNNIIVTFKGIEIDAADGPSPK